MYNILCAGCSFTHGNFKAIRDGFKPVVDTPDHRGGGMKCKFGREGWYPYANFLPGTTWNIGRCGGGITPKYFKKWFWRNKEEKLTHVVYQVPSPVRQPVDLNDFNENHFYQCPAHFKGHYESAGRRKSANPSFPETVFVALRESKLQAFDKIDQYHEKAVAMVDISVNLIRKKQPNAKIIILRYEDTRRPLLREFTKDFYKIMLADYCKDNDISYIYEENFNTQWFKKNKCGLHPNEAGAKLIADKIKEYL